MSDVKMGICNLKEKPEMLERTLRRSEGIASRIQGGVSNTSITSCLIFPAVHHRAVVEGPVRLSDPSQSYAGRIILFW